MSGFSQFIGAVAGQVASRMIMNKVTDLGRQPGSYQLPIPVPTGAGFDSDPPASEPPASRYKIPNWLFFTGYGALLWYAARATAPVEMDALGAVQTEMFDPEQQEIDFYPPKAVKRKEKITRGEKDLLFPGLKRELTEFDIEDIATSDDPIEACLERANWKLDRVDALRQSIFEKEQVDMWETPKPLTASEGELLEDIETCMQKLEAQYGSLAAAGVACSVCDGDDLGAVQREMFDPEQQEIDFDPVPDPQKMPRDQVEFLLNQYLERLEPGQEPTVDGATLHIYGLTGKEVKEVLLGRLRSWGFKNWTNFKAAMKRQRRYATGESKRLYEYLDNLEPGEPANVLDACNWILGAENCTSAQMDSIIDLIKQEGYYYLDDLRKAYKLGDEAKIPAHRKTELAAA